MNRTTITDAYCEQLALVTAGTNFDTNTEWETYFDGTEQQVREFSYNLWMDAQGNKLAKYMEKEKMAHFSDLYEFSYGVPMYEEGSFTITGTERIALMIIDEKASYEKRIKRIRREYGRFKDICNCISDDDKELFVRYFEQSQKVDYEDLRRSVINNLPLISERYRRDEEYRIKQARKDSANIEGSALPIIPKPDIEKRNKRKEKMRRLLSEGR